MAFNQDVFFADNGATSGWTGSGTADAPYQGGSQYVWIDEILGALSGDPLYIQPNRTLRLGPGKFLTNGIDVNGAGWVARSGMRMIGSGINTTTLQLSNPGGNRAAIGMQSVPTVALDGFEASDFTIDCGFAGAANSRHRAISLYGRHIYLRRLRITNFGSTIAGILSVVQPAAVQSEDCIVDQCSIEAPADVGSATIVLITFGGTYQDPHRFCVVRNTLLRGPSGGVGAIHGIVPGCALGFVAEGNQLLDLTSGFSDVLSTETALDIIIRHNYLRNVSTGIDYANRAWPVSRMVVHDNVLDIKTGGTGMLLLASGTSTVYTALILRKNLIRDVSWDVAPTGYITGIYVSRVQDLNVQYNTINNTLAGNGVKIVAGTVTNSTITDNINSAGVPV